MKPGHCPACGQFVARFRWPHRPQPGDVAILLRGVPDPGFDGLPAPCWLKKLLKSLGRHYGFECLAVHQYAAQPTPPSTDGRPPAVPPPS